MNKSNYCFIVGNLGGDPAVRGKSEKAGPVVGFSVAESIQTFDAETSTYKTTHTNWFNVTAFGTTAERVCKHLKKGDRIAVQGRMKVSKYKDKSGEERNGFEIIADEVALWKTLPSAEKAGPASKPTNKKETEKLPF